MRHRFIPPAVARRIDRLSRGAHAFHRYAHHPLCGRYAGELVTLGRRTRLCRGCLAAAAGLACGAAVGWSSHGLPLDARVGCAALLLAVLSALQPRGGKVLRRFVPVLAAAAIAAHGPAPLTILTFVAAGAAFVWYRRRGPNRAQCATCPERTLEVCSGYAPIYRRERAVQRRAGAWLSRAERGQPSPL